MKFNVKADSIFVRPNVPLRKGVVDMENIKDMKGVKVKIKEAEVEALCKKYPKDIEVYVPAKTEKTKDEGEGQDGNSTGTPPPATGDNVATPKDYDDITIPQLQAFLKGKIEGDMPVDKKELYKLYNDQFKKAE